VKIAHRAALLLALLASPLLANDVCTWTESWDNTPDEATDQVVIESGDLTWDASLPDTVASWDQRNTYSNTVTFDTNDWNGFATPPNVIGSGTIFLLSPGGSVLEFR